MRLSVVRTWYFLLALGMLAIPAAMAETQGTPKKLGKFAGAKTTEYPKWFKESFLDFNEDIKDAAKQGKRVLILFEQDGCPYCNALVENNFSQKDIVDKVRKNFEVIAVNMWGDREVMMVDGKPYTEKSLAAALKVQFTPTALFLDEEGKVTLRLNGYLPPDKFMLALDYVIDRKYQQMKYNEFVDANKPAKTSGEMNKQPFFIAAPFDLSVRNGKPIAVFFEQAQCPNCDRLHEVVLAEKETRDIVAAFKCVQLDMWSDTPVTTPDGRKTTAREWAKALDVKYAPSIVVFSADGKEVIRSEAFFKIFHTQGILAYVSSGAFKTEPSFQRYLSARAEHIREQGRDVDIWR